MNIDWIFSGIGTDIISAIIGVIIGGVSGYRVGVRNRIKQVQKAGNNSNLSQTGSIINNNGHQ